MNIFQNLVSKQILKANNDNTNRILIEVFERILILRIGNRDKAIEFIKSYAVNGILPNYGILRMLLVLNLDKLFLIFKPLINADGYIQLFKNIATLKQSAQKHLSNLTDEEKTTLYVFIQTAVQDKELKHLMFESIGISGKGNIEKWFLKMRVSSKSKIADELNIDKKTLDKWLYHFYGKKFRGVRKITLEDYFDIMLNFSLAEGEHKTQICKNLSVYADRLENDLVHNRKTILKDENLEELNYKSLKENLHLQQLDSDMKKVPYSIKVKYIEKLN